MITTDKQGKPVVLTLENATKQFTAGKPVILAEYRSSKADRIRWRDKESKQTVEAPILRHNLEAEDGTPYAVNERVDDKFDETTYVSPFAKGDKVLLTFTALEMMRGAMSFQGKLEKVLVK